MSPLDQNVLLGKSGGKLQIASERLKWLGLSRNYSQMWGCVVVKVMFNAIKNNIGQEPGMLGSWINVSWISQAGDDKSEHRHLRN